MLAISSTLSEFFVLCGAGVIGAVILGLGRAVMGLVRTTQTKKRAAETDQATMSEFLFGTPRDPRTGMPAREGWTRRVDKALETLASGLEEVLSEIKPDRNGRHNLRGIVERGAEAAGATLPPDTEEEPWPRPQR